MFDFRGSGTSAGDLVSVGDFEQRDLLGAIDYAKSLGYNRIGLMGFSMGAAATAVVAPQVPEVQAAVLDSPFADLRTYLEANMPVWTDLPDFPFTGLILAEIPLLTGVNPDRVSPVRELPAFAPRPLLLIHGDADLTVPVSNSEQLLDAANNPNAELWIVPGATHVDSYNTQPQAYLNKISGFFAANLGS